MGYEIFCYKLLILHVQITAFPEPTSPWLRDILLIEIPDPCLIQRSHNKLVLKYIGWMSHNFSVRSGCWWRWGWDE